MRGGLPAPGDPAREWRFSTVSMSAKAERTTCVASGSSFGESSVTLELPPHGERTFRYALAFSSASPQDASARVSRALGEPNVFADEAPCYDSFAPYMWGLLCGNKFLRAFDKLVDRSWFWDDFPVATCAKTCPMYCGDNFITVPRAAEHFCPETGARIGGSSDYFHSSWLDPFFRYRCGVELSGDGRTIRFEPFATDDFRISNVPVAGQEFSFEQRMDGKVRRLSVRDGTGKVIASGEGRLVVKVMPREVPFAAGALESKCKTKGEK